MDRQLRQRVDARFDFGAGLRIAADAVLRTEERDQIDIAMLMQQFDAAAQMAVDAAGASDQSDALAGDQIQLRIQQDFQTEFCGHTFTFLI
ncbi:MAG: hypothetical protein J4G18_14040 [Anaerolineae bacterium]|nr:hypothetical protein [Anaerolineae bacterium]